jgi:DNA-binding transcriptional MerR regulator
MPAATKNTIDSLSCNSYSEFMDVLIAYIDSRLSLEAFVVEINRLLPEFLPEHKANQRVREEITPRLVRYYATLGMLDEPVREGREVRYLYRHLLQFLVVRKLLMLGHGATAIGDTARTRSNEELERLLKGGAQLTIADSQPARTESKSSLAESNPALAFLDKVRSRSQVPQAPAAPRASSMAPPPKAELPKQSQVWVHLEILPGLQVLVREDFILPSTPSECQGLSELIAEQLAQIEDYRRKNP